MRFATRYGIKCPPDIWKNWWRRNQRWTPKSLVSPISHLCRAQSVPSGNIRTHAAAIRAPWMVIWFLREKGSVSTAAPVLKSTRKLPLVG